MAGARRLADLVRRHRLFCGLLAAAAVLRIVVLFTYQPALIFPDSDYYMKFAREFWLPGNARTTGYSLMLAPIPRLGHLGVVPAVQHVMGLATAVLLYALLIRWGCRRGWCAAAVVPVLFDPLQLELEQYVLSDAVFVFIAVAALAVLAWRAGRRGSGNRAAARSPGPSNRAAVIAGLLLAIATLTRMDGAVLALAGIGYVAATVRPRRQLLLRSGLFAAAFALPLVAYAGWYHAARGPWAFTNYSGRFLYGRVAQFADCRGMVMPGYERALCPAEPPAQRYQDYYMWAPGSPQWSYRPPAGRTVDSVAGDFARRVIEHQPLTYLKVVAADYGYGFFPYRGVGPERYPEYYLQFQTYFPDTNPGEADRLVQRFGWKQPYVQPQLARFLKVYGVLYTPGPLLAGALIVGIAGAAGVRRARRARTRPACLLFTAATLLVLVPPAAVSTFDWRYQLPQLALAPAAGVLGLTALRRSDEDGGAAGETRQRPPKALGRTLAKLRPDPDHRP